MNRRVPPLVHTGLGLFGLAALAVLVFAPALTGPFFSDDVHYVAGNPYVHDLDASRLGEIFDPRGEAAVLVGNYAPLHILLHALEWRLFEENVLGYHAVNLAVHVGNAFLLVILFHSFGISILPAAAGGLFFLLHPANVEAVAWVSQLKTLVSLLLALIAVLAFERRPGLATAAFLSGLLVKASAAVALPVVAAGVWLRRDAEDPAARGDRRVAWPWLAAWTLAFLAFAVAQIAAFGSGSVTVEAADPNPWVRLRSSFALAARYLVMAATSYGVSVFHEPEPARSLLDPWWLGGLVGVTGIGGRMLWAFRARRPEAAWWLWAVVSFVPVSQVFVFPFPMADRYLYSMLPGLIGGVLFAARRWTVAGVRTERVWALPLAIGLAAVVFVGLGLRSRARAELWADPPSLMADAAARYPEGKVAQIMRARRAAQRGNGLEAVAALRAAERRGFDRLDQVLRDPVLAGLAGAPGFDAVLRDMAARWIERVDRIENPSQSQLYSLAVAHRMRGEIEAARRALERALERGGPLDGPAREALRALPPPGRESPGASR